MNTNKLDKWFGLSRASFLVLPRVLIQEMPTKWQKHIVELLEEYEETFDTSDIGIHHTTVMAVGEQGKFTKMPKELLNYRHPDYAYIEKLRKQKDTTFLKEEEDSLYGFILTTACCGKGPIVDERYCPNCGRRINNIN